MSDSEDAKKVIVVDLQMPFFSIVVLMVKWVLASIPAIIFWPSFSAWSPV